MKLKISNRSENCKIHKYVEINTLLNNQWNKKGITRGIRKYLEINNNENATYRNLWDATKAIFRVKFKL